MKSLLKPIHFQNSRQEIVFAMGFLQILLLILALLFMQCKQADKKLDPNQNPVVETPIDTNKNAHFLVDSNYVAIAGHHSEEIKQKLKNLENLRFTEGGIANQVLDYLKRGDTDFGEEFKFIELQFLKRTANIVERFNKEIPELTNIMISFPNLKIKLMAYTDNVGDEKLNEKLSQDRALAIQTQLTKAGIAAERIQIKAFGEKYPVANNKTFDGQMLNNRIEMMILSK